MSLYGSDADIAAIRYKAHRGSVFEDTGETVCKVGPLRQLALVLCPVVDI
jgi:hypothetical protein